MMHVATTHTSPVCGAGATGTRGNDYPATKDGPGDWPQASTPDKSHAIAGRPATQRAANAGPIGAS